MLGRIWVLSTVHRTLQAESSKKTITAFWSTSTLLPLFGSIERISINKGVFSKVWWKDLRLLHGALFLTASITPSAVVCEAARDPHIFNKAIFPALYSAFVAFES